MNFCAVILILKMEENTQHFHHIILYYLKKGKNTTEMQKKVCAESGEGAVTNQMCQTWFVKLHDGDFSLDDAPQLDRPGEVHIDQTET